MRFCTIITLLCLFLSFQAQAQLTDHSTKLRFYGDVMVSALEAENRQLASQEFYKNFKIYMDSTNAYAADLSDFRTLSVLESGDKRFRLISWQVEQAAYDFKYYGFIVFEDGGYLELKHSRSPDISAQYMSLACEEWYGALYYNLMPVSDNEYVVFGYNGHDRFDHIKIADVFVFSDENELVMGKEVFEDREEPGSYNHRVILKYSSDASVNLNFNPGLNMIVMDHLTPRMGKQEGQGQTMFPDGTYEAYEPSEDKWKYISKLYDHSYGENNAPRPKPVLDKKRDLFGN